jgi:DNA-binding LytR/AlgR family response regulator
MTKLRCMIVEDERHMADHLANMIEESPLLELLYVYTNPVEALTALKEIEIDLIFLDVNMPGITGIEFLKIAKGKALFILCTAYPDYAIQGYELDVIFYLLKPVTLEKFMLATSKAIDSYEIIHGKAVESANHLFVKNRLNSTRVRIDFNEIFYIESDKNIAKFHFINEHIECYSSITKIADQLPQDQFVQIKSSLIVALDKISRYDRNTVMLKDNRTELVIGPSFREAFIARMRNKKID